MLDFNAYKKANFSIVYCEHNSSTTVTFDQWWSNYYLSIEVPWDNILTKTTNKFVPVQKDDPKKTRGMHIKEIYASKCFFKAKWNPQHPWLSVYDADTECQQKKAIHDVKWRGTFIDEFIVNRTVEPKQFCILFKFPPLLSHLFGLANLYLDPTKGTLGVNIDPPRKQTLLQSFTCNLMNST